MANLNDRQEGKCILSCPLFWHVAPLVQGFCPSWQSDMYSGSGELDDPLRFEKLPEWIRQADNSGSEFLSIRPNLLAHQTSSTNGGNT